MICEACNKEIKPPNKYYLLILPYQLTISSYSKNYIICCDCSKVCLFYENHKCSYSIYVGAYSLFDKYIMKYGIITFCKNIGYNTKLLQSISIHLPQYKNQIDKILLLK